MTPRKRHFLVDTLGLIIANRVEPAHMPDQRAGARLLSGLRALFPAIRTVMADAGHQSRKLACDLLRHDGWQLRITHRGQRAFQVPDLDCRAQFRLARAKQATLQGLRV